MVIMGDITRRIYNELPLLKTFFALAMAAALALVLMPGMPAMADELEPGAGRAAEANQMQTVYVYAQIAPGVDASGAEVNELGWYTIGTIQLSLPVIPENGPWPTASVPDAATLNAALANIVRYDENKSLSLENATWKELKVAQGATSYPEATGGAWHLDGELACQAAPGTGDNTSTPDTPGNAGGTTPEPGPSSPEPSSPFNPDTQKPSTPDSSGQQTSSSSSAPAQPNASAATADAETGNTQNPDDRAGFATAVRGGMPDATVEPAAAEPTADEAEPAPVEALPVELPDDVAPLAAGVGETIAEEEVPMGAFDEPIDPAPWVAGLGSLVTALYATVAVGRRLSMAQRLKSFEDEVLGCGQGAEEVAQAAAGQHVL